MEKEYLDVNYTYWNHTYIDENVESHVFRPYGRIFRDELNLSGPGKKLLDFGCGSGSALAFFRKKGFDVYGVDISSGNIEYCKTRMPDISENFSCIDPDPSCYSILFGGEYDLVTAIQSLYYFSNSDLQICLKKLFKNMKRGGGNLCDHDG